MKVPILNLTRLTIKITETLFSALKQVANYKAKNTKSGLVFRKSSATSF